ncbi:hypothetical protein [Leptodesmis sp.]
MKVEDKYLKYWRDRWQQIQNQQLARQARELTSCDERGGDDG